VAERLEKGVSRKKYSRKVYEALESAAVVCRERVIMKKENAEALML